MEGGELLKYEYICTFHSSVFDVSALGVVINKYGNDGWELVNFQIVFGQGNKSGTNLIFKRKK